ncbi:MAG: exodeoxyribonuclease VII large subunit [Ruminococcus sp.]|nr:exodeoxyribonuclease VII large subunit [Ruminococcus sp.]
MPVLTVSQINRYLSFRLKEDKNIQGIMVKGEISDYVRNYRSGHVYFTLKDKESSLKAVMFSSSASRLKFEPEDGMSVILSGSIAVYERDGVYQIYVNDIHPDGAGVASVALNQLKEKLKKAGLFDQAHKRSLPESPKKIGAVTSLSGAAIRDIINVLKRRYPLAELYAVNATVQGENAPDSICRGIAEAEKAGCEVIIVGRGGGSAEDLSAFNTEKVAYGIYNCRVPVISAVGHETDFTIADLTADMRAPTPSAAAELAVPSIENISERLNILERRMKNAVNNYTDRQTDRFILLNSRLLRQSPSNRLRLNEERLLSLELRNKRAFEGYISRMEMKLDERISRLELLSPLKIMSRGYSLVYKGESLVRSAEELEKGDRIRIRLSEGEAEAEITNISR